jgi:hypothetical protein
MSYRRPSIGNLQPLFEWPAPSMAHTIFFALDSGTTITCGESSPCTLSERSIAAKVIRGALPTRPSFPFSTSRPGESLSLRAALL